MESISKSTDLWSYRNPLERPDIKEAVGFAVKSAKLLINLLPRREAYLKGKTIMEIGTGQDFGMPLILIGYGANSMIVDPYLCQWDVSFHPKFYSALRKSVIIEFSGINTESIDQVLENGQHIADGLKVIGMGLEDINNAFDGAIDISYSNAVFEHLVDANAAIRKLAQFTCDGGLGFHQIDFRAHRDFDRPLEFLTMTEKDLIALLYERSWTCGNALRFSDFKNLFEANGFDIRFEPSLLINENYLHDVFPRLHERYKTLSEDELRILSGRFFLRKKK